MRLAFLGSPEVSARILHRLVEAGHDVSLVVTGPDRRRGRGAALAPTPVKAEALRLGLPVGEAASDAAGAGAELGVVVAFGQLIRPAVLERLRFVNVHFSLLPRWRGAAPVERAILAGDEETGVCLMALEEGLDTGPIYSRSATPIGPEETAEELTLRLGELGGDLLLDGLAGGLPEPVPQEGEATYAKKLSVEELELDFGAPALICLRVVRVGRAWTTFRRRRLLVHRAALAEGPATKAPGTLEGDVVHTGAGLLRLLEVQGEGRAAQPFSQWRRGARPEPGERLGA